MKGLVSEIRQNVKFSPKIPVRLIAGHLVLSSFSYVTTHLATSLPVPSKYLSKCKLSRSVCSR